MNTTEHRRTRHFNIMLIVLAVAGLVAALVIVGEIARASQKSVHGWTGHHEDGDVAGAICDVSHDGRMEQVGDYLGVTLDLDATQMEAWDRVEHGLERGLELLRDSCGNPDSHALPPTTPERLVLMESAMAAGTETLRAVRPAFEAFYRTLDESQRHKIDELSRHHGPRIR